MKIKTRRACDFAEEQACIRGALRQDNTPQAYIGASSPMQVCTNTLQKSLEGKLKVGCERGQEYKTRAGYRAQMLLEKRGRGREKGKKREGGEGGQRRRERENRLLDLYFFTTFSPHKN